VEKAFQQILTEIYHIVSKKVLDSEDNRPKVRQGSLWVFTFAFKVDDGLPFKS
jgi:hypothetical protein